MTDFDYFYGKQPEQYAFYRTPKVLFIDKRFESLTAEAKLLYGILLDRMSLSISNNWTDREGRNYIYMTIDSIENEMGCARQKACKLLDELEGLGLIERIRQGVGKPNIIYVKNFYTAGGISALSMKIKSQECDNQTSGSMKIKSLEVLKSNGNNTYINNTNNSKTNLLSDGTLREAITAHRFRRFRSLRLCGVA